MFHLPCCFLFCFVCLFVCFAETTEVYFLTVLEVGNSRSRCWQDWFLLRPLPSHVAMAASVLPLAVTVSSHGLLCMCISRISASSCWSWRVSWGGCGSLLRHKSWWQAYPGVLTQRPRSCLGPMLLKCVSDTPSRGGSPCSFPLKLGKSL